MAVRKEPQNIEAEIAVLGCAFLNQSALDKICEELSSEMFYNEPNRVIYEVLKELNIKNIPVDSTTVVNELDKKKLLSKAGGIEYITEIISSVASIAHLNYHIKIIYEEYILRCLIEKSTGIIDSCYEEKDEIEVIVENAERNILSVYSDRMGKEISKVQDLLPEVQAQIEELAKTKKEFTGIRTGFHDLDKLTRGLQKNQVIILAGRPGTGKSAMALNIALNAAITSKKTIAFFSLEMGAEEIIKRMFACIGQIEGDILSTGKLNHNDWKKLNEAMSQLADTNFFIDDSADLSVSEIRRKSRRLKNSEKGLDLIVVDYLQLVNSSSKYQGQRVQEVSEISRDMKKLAMELGVPVIALAQLSRSSEQRKGDDRKPKLSDLRESGSIEQDADIVLFLYNENYTDYSDLSPKINLLIAKHRAGSTGEVPLVFEKRTGSFKNYLKGDEE